MKRQPARARVTATIALAVLSVAAPLAYASPALASTPSAISLTKARKSIYPLTGDTYAVYSNSSCTQKKATIVLDSSGKGLAANLPAGTYYVKETKPLVTYNFDNSVHAAKTTSGKTTNIYISSSLKSSSISMKAKGDGHISVAGAEYGVYANSSCTSSKGTIITDANGDGRLDNLPAGTYYIKETKAPKGYSLDTTVHRVTTTPGTTGGFSVTFNPSAAENQVYYKIVGPELHLTSSPNGTSWTASTDGWRNNTSITKVVIEDKISVDSCKSFFAGMTNLTSIDGLENLDTSQVTDMSYMFQNCRKLTKVNVSSFDTSHVTNMYGMFVSCCQLSQIDGLENWDVSNVTSMHLMFSNCTNIQSLPLGSWTTNSLTDTFKAFAYCRNARSIDLSNWNMARVTNASGMFLSCTSLLSLDTPATCPGGIALPKTMTDVNGVSHTTMPPAAHLTA